VGSKRLSGVNVPCDWATIIGRTRSSGSEVRLDESRIALATFCLVICTTMATAKTQSEDKKPDDSAYSAGRTGLPDNKGQLQPQGWSGPLNTGTGDYRNMVCERMRGGV